jgi:hypothetical protein
MRQTDDDDAVADDAVARNALTIAMNERTERSGTTEESMASAFAATEPAEEPLAQPAIPAPTLRFLLHKDTPLWRFGH